MLELSDDEVIARNRRARNHWLTWIGLRAGLGLLLVNLATLSDWVRSGSVLALSGTALGLLLWFWGAKSLKDGPLQIIRRENGELTIIRF